MSEDITTLLHTALADEPPSAMDPRAVLATARGRRRRRHITTAATGTVVAGLLAAVVAGTVSAASPDPATQAHAHDAAAQPDARQPGHVSPAADRPSTPASAPADSLAGLTESTLHVRLDKISSAASKGGLALDAGIASARDQTLFVYKDPAGTSVPSLNCRDFSGDGVNGDGYTGPCTVHKLPHGALMIVRSGTSLGKYTKTQAGILHADGSAVFAEATNQRQVEHVKWKVDKSGHWAFRNAPVVSAQPPVTAKQLAKLVQVVDART